MRPQRMRNLVYGLGATTSSNSQLVTDVNVAPGAVGGGLAVFGAVLEVLNPDRKVGLSKECSSRRQNPAWLKNLRE